jgi:ubiquinone/menaquinone biosynthesis C-methylase UbiE
MKKEHDITMAMNERRDAVRLTWDDLSRIKRFEKGRERIGPAFAVNIRKICERFLPDNGPILDIGSGDGALLRRLPESYAKRTIHTDISSNYVKELKLRHSEAEAAAADAVDLPFKDNSFDAVVSLSTLHTIDNLERAMSETTRVLKPGGKFVNILDITPSPIPMIDYLTAKKRMIIPAKEDLGDKIAFFVSFKTPLISQVENFIKNNPDLDEKLLHKIALLALDPHSVYKTLDMDKSGSLKALFASELDEVDLP